MKVLSGFHALALCACVTTLPYASAIAASFDSGSRIIFKNLETDYGGVTSATLNAAISDARRYFRAVANGTYVITIPAGTYSMPDTIDVQNIKPGPQGKLVIQGAGPNWTTLVGDQGREGFQGRNTYRFVLKDIGFTLSNYTTTLGHVFSVSPGQVTLDISSGFPTPLEIYDPYMDHGRYLRAYTNDPKKPKIITQKGGTNPQIRWNTVSPVPNYSSRWTFTLANPDKVAPYQPGMLVGVKSKNPKNIINLCVGSDFTLQNATMTQRSRMIFHCGFDHITIDHVHVVRAPAINGQVPALATPDGGPQIGEPRDSSTDYNIVENSFFEATGDDSIALFNNGNHTVVRNNRVIDSFARGINLNASCNVQLENTVLKRNPLLIQNCGG